MESTEFSDIQQYAQILRRRLVPVLSILVSVSVIAVIAAYLQKPTYQAEGKLILRRESSTPALTGLGKEISQIAPVYETSIPLDTQAEIIRSAPLTQKTIDTLNLQRDPMLIFQGVGGDVKFDFDIVGFLLGKPDTDKRIKLRAFLRKLKVDKVRGTDVLTINYRDKDPRRAAEVVNTLMNLYLQDNIQVNRATAIAARKFLEEQLPEAEISVRRAELDLRRFKETNQVVVLEEEEKSAVAIIEDLRKQLNKAQSDYAEVSSRVDALQSQLNLNVRQALTVTALSQAPGIQDVLQQLQQAESQLAVERARFTDQNPAIADIQDQVNNLRGLLQSRIQATVEQQLLDGSVDGLQFGRLQQDLSGDLVQLATRQLGLFNQINALARLQTDYQTRSRAFPRLAQQQRELVRRLDAAQSTYELLLQKLQEARVVENQNIGNARIVAAAATPDRPIAPRKLFYGIAGVLLGGLLGVGTALFLETRDRSIRTVEAARKLLGFNLLWVFPVARIPTKALPGEAVDTTVPQIVVTDQARSPLRESYRMLYTNLRSYHLGQAVKVLVITSSVPKEGKSTIAANLAGAMAQAGCRVLLIDADLYRPLQHRIWQLPNQIGLCQVLQGHAELSQAIQPKLANLDILTAGYRDTETAIALDSRQIHTLIQDLTRRYDFVIFDTPPLTVAADAPMLGQLADGVLMVVRLTVADADSVLFAREVLEQSGLNVLGIVINGAMGQQQYSYCYQNYPDEPTVAAKGVQP